MGNGIVGSWSSYTDVTIPSSTFAALLGGGSWTPNSDGSAKTLYYSFPTGSAYFEKNYGTNNESANWSPLTSAEQTAVKSALAAWESVANVHFVQVSESSSQAGDIRFGIYNGMSSSYSGWAYGPGSWGSSGDVWFNPAMNSNSVASGSWYYETALHEIGHALGLKHPFETSTSNSNTLTSQYDNSNYTIMSYTHPTSVNDITPAFFDIQAIQYLYGTNNTATAGNNTYYFQKANQTIWDYSGTDTLDFSGATAACTIDLTPNSLTTSGNYRTYIMPATTIENVVGSQYNDTIKGNTANNTIQSGTGDDVITGGGGLDTFVFAQNKAGVDTITDPALGDVVKITGASLTGNVAIYNGVTNLNTVKYANSNGNTDLYIGVGNGDAKHIVLNGTFSASQFSLAGDTITLVAASGSASPPFNVWGYLAGNSDLYKAFGVNVTSAVNHFLNYGSNEGRQLASFDAYAYAVKNPDLYNAFGTNVDALINHYLTYGKNEGRQATGFDVYAYAVNNPDLYKAFGTNASALISHYLSYGQAEGRKATGFDAYSYEVLNPDLYKAFGADANALVSHYLNYGKNEGRATGFTATASNDIQISGVASGGDLAGA